MASDPIKVFLEQALVSLSENRPEEAIQILDRIGDEGNNIPDQLSYRGLANAKLGNLSEAEKLLRRAVELDPSQCRHRYVLAVQLRDAGKRKEASEEAQLAAKLDRKFPGLPALFSSLDLEFSSDSRTSMRDRLFAPALAAPKFGKFHAFAALEQNEGLWTLLGWVLVGLSFAAPILVRFHLPFHRPAAGEPNGLPILGNAVLNTDPLSLTIVFMFVTVSLLCAGWIVTDMLDRRSRALWIIPFVPFCCLCGLPGIGQAIYMSLGRK